MNDTSLLDLKKELKEVLRYIKKLEHTNKSLRGSITNCKKRINEYEMTNKALFKIYKKVTERMREIEFDYKNLMKIEGIAITFFDKRKENGDWGSKRDHEND